MMLRPCFSFELILFFVADDSLSAFLARPDPSAVLCSMEKKSRGGLSKGVVRRGLSGSPRGLSRGLSGLCRLASTCSCHNHTYHQKHGTTREAQLEMSPPFPPSPPVCSSSLVSPFRSRSHTLLDRASPNSCADWGHVAVEASSAQETSAHGHPGGPASFA